MCGSVIEADQEYRGDSDPEPAIIRRSAAWRHRRDEILGELTELGVPAPERENEEANQEAKDAGFLRKFRRRLRGETT